MKILYIGHYKENSGWSQAAIDNILALDSCGLDVVCRNFTLTHDNENINARVLDLEKKDLTDVDYCIQHVLPHHLVGTNIYKKNIAYYVHETDNLNHHIWKKYLSLVDEIWTPNNDNISTLNDAGFENVKLVPHTFNLNVYKKQYQKINLSNNCFYFYYIGDFDDRKNIKSILKCFYSEFHSFEPVRLVLKIKKNNVNLDSFGKEVTKYLNNIKRNLRIYNDIKNYNKEILILEDLSREDILRIHSSCNCFINTSFGEAWSIPSFEAMCFGNTPICTNFAGPKEFIDSNNINTGKLINGCWTICEHSSPPFKEVWTAHEHWMTPDEKEIKKAMRYYYENKDKINKNDGLIRAENFSYSKIGNLMKEHLENE